MEELELKDLESGHMYLYRLNLDKDNFLLVLFYAGKPQVHALMFVDSVHDVFGADYCNLTAGKFCKVMEDK